MATTLPFPELQEQTHDTGCKRFFKIRPDAKVTAEWGGTLNCYRYKLLHQWDTSKPLAMVGLMNPSGAGLEFNDATIDKSDKMADFWGAGGVYVGNSHGYRARDNDELLSVPDPVGPRNDDALYEMACVADLIVVGAGKLPNKILQANAERMYGILASTGKQLYVLGLNKDGSPKHPMTLGKGIVPVRTIPVPWSKWPGRPSNLLEKIASRTPSR